MLSVTNHQGNVDQNHSETSPHPWQNSHTQKQERARVSAGEDGENLEPGTPTAEMQYGTADTENSVKLPQKLKTELPYDSAIPLLSIWGRKWQLTSVFLPGKSHGQRRACWATHAPRGHRESDTTWQPNQSASLVTQLVGNLPACRSPRFIPWARRIPWRREWQPTPVFLPGEFHTQRSLVGYSPWGHKESETTEQLIQHIRFTDPISEHLFERIKIRISDRCPPWSP